MSTTTNTVAAPAHDKEFSALLRRLLISVNHLELVSQHFGDLASLPQEHVPAAFTLQGAAEALDSFYNELDSWWVRHTHLPTDSRTFGLGVFTDDTAARTHLPGLPPAQPCPFCVRVDDIMVSQVASSRFRANCGICGADAPGADTALDAAHQWNKRGTPEIVAPESTHEATTQVRSYASDNTADRIRAFLMSVRPLRGASHVADQDEYQRGRVTIERMANASHDTDEPDFVVTLSEAADVLKFLTWVEPFDPDHWWKDPENAPSHVCGLGFVLRTLERSLRSKEAQL